LKDLYLIKEIHRINLRKDDITNKKNCKILAKEALKFWSVQHDQSEMQKLLINYLSKIKGNKILMKTDIKFLLFNMVPRLVNEDDPIRFTNNHFTIFLKGIIEGNIIWDDTLKDIKFKNRDARKYIDKELYPSRAPRSGSTKPTDPESFLINCKKWFQDIIFQDKQHFNEFRDKDALPLLKLFFDEVVLFDDNSEEIRFKKVRNSYYNLIGMLKDPLWDDIRNSVSEIELYSKIEKLCRKFDEIQTLQGMDTDEINIDSLNIKIPKAEIQSIIEVIKKGFPKSFPDFKAPHNPSLQLYGNHAPNTETRDSLFESGHGLTGFHGIHNGLSEGLHFFSGLFRPM